MDEPVAIRPMAAGDAEAVLRIYQEGLDTGDASFDLSAPDWDGFDRARLPDHRFVATDGATGDVVGWIAASAVSDRCAYSGVIEHSLYVAATARRRGIGLALIETLVESAERAGVWTVQTQIFPENQASVALHGRAGFRVVGLRHRLGRHHGRWRDVLLMERSLTADP
jgi:phosphinothricin acetyltransferase